MQVILLSGAGAGKGGSVTKLIMIREDTQWEVVCSREAFEKLRADPSFHLLLALARAVNSMRFTHQAMLDLRGQDTPAAVRQRMNSFMYTGALLFEGIELSKRLGKHFREMEAFKEGFAQIHKDGEAQRLLSETLKPLRNRAVFHFDIESIAEALSGMESEEFVFLRALGRQSGSTYYNLADAAALRLVFGSSETAEQFDARVNDLIARVADLAVRFLRAADKLIAASLRTPAWQLRTHQDVTSSRDV